MPRLSTTFMIVNNQPSALDPDLDFVLVQTSEPMPLTPGHEARQQQYRWELHLEPKEGKTLDNIESVEFRLHESFRNPIRKKFSAGNGFQCKSKGWGSFIINMEVVYRNMTKHHLGHVLQLASVATGGSSDNADLDIDMPS